MTSSTRAFGRSAVRSLVERTPTLLAAAGAALFLSVPDLAFAGGGGGGGGVQAVTVDAPGAPWLGSTILLRSLATLLAAAFLWSRRSSGGHARPSGVAAVALLVLALPFELVAGGHADQLVQLVSAAGAVPLLALTGVLPGLGVAPPALFLPNVTVYVTRECASASGLAAWLAVVLLVVHLLPLAAGSRGRVVGAALALAVLTNIVRIAVSAHAAVLWAADRTAWDLAHDLIGYGVYALFYAAFALWVWRVARSARPLTASPVPLTVGR